MRVTFDELDESLAGRLAGRLAFERRNGRSCAQIAARLRLEGFSVSVRQVRSWCEELLTRAETAE